MTRRFAQEELNSQVVKFREKTAFINLQPGSAAII